jgi:hypothetical protein
MRAREFIYRNSRVKQDELTERKRKRRKKTKAKAKTVYGPVAYYGGYWFGGGEGGDGGGE